MAKTGLSQVTTSQTFQTWLDRTNEIVTILGSDAMTASALGDTTTGNSTLVGSFTANTVIAFDNLRTDLLSPKSGSTSIGVNAPVNITTSLQVVQNLTSAQGPRVNLSSGSVTWRTGFENITTNDFIVDTGTGTAKLKLSTAGNLSVAGSITSGTGGFAGNLTGDVTGTVSDISNHDTDDLSEGATNLYFTTARARAALSEGTGITITNGQISIGQAVATTSNVTFANQTLSGSLSIQPTGNAVIEHGRVDGTASTPSIDFHSSGDNIDYNSRIVASGGNNTIGNGSLAYIAEGGHTFTGAITSTDDITAFASSSDIRKKENIEKIGNALEKVSQVSGYTYNFKGDDRRITGVIAQELEHILPEAVYEVDDEEYGKTKAVRYGNIVGLLIEAIKDLKKEVEDLKNGN